MRLLVVTVATFPAAVYRILEKVDHGRPDERVPRHQFAGQLLGRIHPGGVPMFRGDTPGHLRAMAKQIMGSRIVVNSGGPIGYLEPGAS
ncbi:MAG: hypothetical protein ACYC1Z_00670 [Georgenia sp.]